MKAITNYINEGAEQIKLSKAKQDGYANLSNVDGEALLMMCQIVMRVLSKPSTKRIFNYNNNAEAAFENAKGDIVSICDYILDNYDDIINV